MRAQRVKTLLWALVGAAVVAAFARFWHGLGAATALTDRTPWGLWIGFDVMGGVALAAGGFVLAGAVYVFHIERLRPVLRPAILTAFLGYAAVVVGLLCDLGRPYNVWQPMIHWQHHSAMFEVAWCVILYLTVLILEVSPMVLEKTRFQRVYRLLKRFTVPLVILGIMLSTLHQSSLGTLMLIMPFRVHPLWYSPILPVLFFISAVGLGLMMVTAESLTTAWLYEREPETELLSTLARPAAAVLSLYVAVRLGDLGLRGSLALDGTLQARLFVVEMGLTLIAVVLLLLPWTRRHRVGLGVAASLVVAAFVVNRLTISGIATLSTTGDSYMPSWIEILISAGVVASAALAFFFFVERYDICLPREASPTHRPRARWAGWLTNGLAFCVAAVAAYLALPEAARSGSLPLPTPVKSARGGDVLLIDGNRRHQAVAFDHATHKELLDDEKSCAKCHHMNRPLEKASRCTECHRDMLLPTRLFDHKWHARKLGLDTGCRSKCHLGQEYARAVRACRECHQTMRAKDTLIKGKGDWVHAPGYKDAMHGLCIPCHAKNQKEADAGKSPAELASSKELRLDQCAACHRKLPEEIRTEIKSLHAR